MDINPFYWLNQESLSFEIYCIFDFWKYTEQICGYDQTKDTCQGDSGGPMTVMESNTQYLVGVTSYGNKKCGLAK